MNETLKPIIEHPPKIWTPEEKLELLVNGKNVVFQFPAFGPYLYNHVVKQVLAKGQRLPTGKEIAYMIHRIYESNQLDNSIGPIRDMMKSMLWVPVRNIWTPKSVKNPGVYTIHDENGLGLSGKIDILQLEDILIGSSIERRVRFSRDRKVCFAPLDTITPGTLKKGTLSQDGAFISNYGIEGAEKLDQFTQMLGVFPFSYVFNNCSDKPVQTLSTLRRDVVLNAHMLSAGFCSNGGNSGYVVSISGSDQIVGESK